MARRSEAWELELQARGLRQEWWGKVTRHLGRAAGRLARHALDPVMRSAGRAADGADPALPASPPVLTRMH